MKKTAIIFGTIGVIIFLLSVLFKLLHWPGAGLLLVWGSFFILIIVIPIIAAYTLSKASTNKRLYFFGAISAFIWLAGIIFKFQHWPAQAILLVAGTAMLIVFTVLFAMELNKKELK
ncbi:MAG: hypothetical protein K9G38_03165 [Bacteroidales bacterium]|nr:hypothetical protein [Bacteroidales bacterium]